MFLNRSLTRKARLIAALAAVASGSSGQSLAQDGKSFTSEQTIRYIMAKLQQTLQGTEQWYRLSYKYPWFTFEYDNAPTKPYAKLQHYHTAIDLTKVKFVSAREMENNRFRLGFSCSGGHACGRYDNESSTGPIWVNLWITSATEARQLENAFDHLLSKLPLAAKDPFSN
jgi:hypothetical protein